MRFPLIAGTATLIVASVVIAGLIEAGLIHYGLMQHARYCVMAAAVCLLAAVLAMLPVWLLAMWQGVQGAAMGFLAGMVFRLFLCGGGLMILQRTIDGNDQALAMWIAGWYLIELTIEVAIISRFVIKAPPPKSDCHAGETSP